MASFFSRLFGRASSDTPSEAASGSTETYGDCRIRATPMKEGSQFRLSGVIEKDMGGQILSRSFIRADMFSSADEASSAALRKAHQIIDENGPSLFSDGAASRSV
ncbi:transcriptional activator HlyU [Rhizobium sp. Leaf384]|uniref:HlyU family transcriptional regulator n=1 Tax=unclassified Rhizobium TaxID=2613769 RepID=UPI0007131146|nr:MULTISPECIES: HlyU family transcriptional regulator [unclassified Rhizobium]KQS74374.1 transcriptional activator HlyU [Rhizobium sp. Leaf383]KQS80113.1 transcriptional activator HlyU [Rhizobium sp. Leaf384]